MKNIFLFLSLSACLLVGFSAGAKQIEQGKLEISGDLDISFFRTKTDAGGDEIDDDTTTIGVDSLYYLAPNFGLGLSLLYERDKSDSDKFTTTMIGPNIGYNISLNDQISIKPIAMAGWTKIKAEGDGYDSSVDGIGWGIGADLCYFITDTVSINTGVKYMSLKLDGDDMDVDIDTFGAEIGISVYLL